MSFYGNRVPRGWVPQFPLANHSPVPPALRPGAAELLGIKEPEPETLEVHEELDGFDPDKDNDEAVAKELLSLAAERLTIPEPPPVVVPDLPKISAPVVSSEESPVSPEDEEILEVASDLMTEEDTTEEPVPKGPEVLVASTAKKRPGRPKKNSSAGRE